MWRFHFPILASATALVLLSVVNCGLALVIPKLLQLERTFPPNHAVELDSLRAWDGIRHSRMLQEGDGGVDHFVQFPVNASYDPLLGLPGTFVLYYTKVKLGTPPTEFNIQIDTGSDLLWVTCNPCSGCPQTSEDGNKLNFFDASTSSTAKLIGCSDPICTYAMQTSSTQCSPENNQCIYTIRYMDKSETSGHYVTDALYFDPTSLGQSLISNSSAPIVFGCSTNLSGGLARTDRAVEGIFGFGQGKLSVISQLSSQGITPKVFSHCLKGDGNGGGILVLGEIQDPSIVYSPLVPSTSHYNLDLQSIALNGQILPIDPKAFATSNERGAIVDSGTTLAYLVEQAYDPFVNYVADYVSPSVTPISEENRCYKLHTSVSDIFPLVSLNFAGGASMVLKPEEYLTQQNSMDDAAMWCMGFQRVQAGGLTILGDLVLKDKIFVYDLAHQRVGWANYDCSMPVNVSVTSNKDEHINQGQLSSTGSSSREMFFKMLPAAFVALLLLHTAISTQFQFL